MRSGIAARVLFWSALTVGHLSLATAMSRNTIFVVLLTYFEPVRQERERHLLVARMQFRASIAQIKLLLCHICSSDTFLDQTDQLQKLVFPQEHQLCKVYHRNQGRFRADGAQAWLQSAWGIVTHDR